jgi:hypothetical protein
MLFVNTHSFTKNKFYTIQRLQVPVKSSPQKGDKKSLDIFFLLNSDFAMLSAEPEHIDFDGFILRTYVRAMRSVAINFYIFFRFKKISIFTFPLLI